MTATTTLPTVETYAKKYPDIPKEVILKEDLLRLGLNITKDAMELSKGCREQAYYLFSYNISSHDELADGVSTAAPEDIRFHGGPYGLRPTSVRGRALGEISLRDRCRRGQADDLRERHARSGGEFSRKAALLRQAMRGRNAIRAGHPAFSTITTRLSPLSASAITGVTRRSASSATSITTSASCASSPAITLRPTPSRTHRKSSRSLEKWRARPAPSTVSSPSS